MRFPKAINAALVLWLSSCAMTDGADDIDIVRFRFQTSGHWSFVRCVQDGSESSAEGFAVSFSDTDAIVFGPKREVVSPVEWTRWGVMYSVEDDLTKRSSHSFKFTTQPKGFDLIDADGNVALRVRLLARAYTCGRRMEHSLFFATATAEKDSPLAMFEGANWLMHYEPPEAQPGATDNPDDARRLREDH